MSLPDQKYMNHVRDALWSRAERASVMIGSGFSKNAEPARPDAVELPLWHELARAMFDKLHPPGVDGSQHSAPPSASDPNVPLRLAQEYKDTFGRSSLHLFLQQHVRHEDFNPGEFHRRLLKLTWRDVFTTNWDTLLERTRRSVPERPYSVVHNRDEIPLSAQPRIVKLHGSLDGHYPLVVAEEDYLAYRDHHAPFVNTVQQAMMETVFLLVGFSGSDPNFVKWSTWVQDNLGESAPRIYIAGWLELSDDQRDCLQARNVFAIDLAQHPKAAHWPEHLHHRYATDWILRSLEGGRPYDVANWPTPPTQTLTEPPAHLRPVDVVTSDNPIEEPWSPKTPGAPLSIEDSTRELLTIWTKNRGLYPGWLVAPLEVREPLISRTRTWQPTILQIQNSLPTIERLDAIRDLVWRHETTLEPITSELESAAQDVLSSISNGQPNNGIVESHNVSQIREAWREVALSLVTLARHRLDEGMFTRQIEIATQFLDDNSDVGHRLHHERCLWSAWSLDFEALDSLLTDWKTENCDPIWMLRKAALLSEAGRDEDAIKLTEQAIADIRRFPVDDRSVAGPSREGWALGSTIDHESRSEVFNRWNELASRKCNAYAELAGITRTLSNKEASSNPPPFDLGTVQDGWSIRFESGNRPAPAFRAIRLSEVAGLPAATPQAFPPRATGADILRLAAEHVVKFNPELAIRLVLRSCTYDKDKSLMRVLSRNHLALLPDDAVRKLVRDCMRVIDYSLSRGWVERSRVGMEVVSRLVSRLESDSALETFDYAFEVYRNRQHRVMSHAWIGPPLENLLRRTWKSLPQNHRRNRALDLLGAPIVGLDSFTAQIAEHYPDPGELVSGDSGMRLPDRTDDNEAQWQDVVDLLIRALRAGGEARKRAANRLAPMAIEGLLTVAEVSEVSDALWAAEYVPADGLPTATSLYDWAFLVLPEPEPRLADRRFRRRWLTCDAVKSRHDVSDSGGTVSVSLGSSPNNPTQLEDTLWYLGGAIAELRARGSSFDLTDAEREHVIDLVSQWAKASVKTHTDIAMQFELRRYSLWAVEALGPILSRIEIPAPVGETLFRKLKTLTESGTPAFGPIGSLVRVIPHRASEMASWLRTGLASGSHDMASGALSGLAAWMHLSINSDSLVQSPPEDILRELGLIIAARRKESLSEALLVAKQVFDEGSGEMQDIILNFTLEGLDYLAEELRYDGEHGDNDVPNLRWRCAQLASSMSQAGFGCSPAVTHWLQIASADPFPEVRNAPMDNLGGSFVDTSPEHREV